MNPEDWGVKVSVGGDSYYHVDGEWKVIDLNTDPVVSKKMKRLHEQFPALEKAWQEYMTIYNLCDGKDHE